jgi:hypothetical protein
MADLGTGDPNSPHWWMWPMTAKELTELRASVKYTHERGLGVASITWNRIEIALAELQQRMDTDERTTSG